VPPFHVPRSIRTHRRQRSALVSRTVAGGDDAAPAARPVHFHAASPAGGHRRHRSLGARRSVGAFSRRIAAFQTKGSGRLYPVNIQIPKYHVEMPRRIA